MEIILLENVGNVGKLGQKVKVKAGYARNYLLPQKKAAAATAENLEQFETKRAELEAKAAETLAQAKERALKLADVKVKIVSRASEEGKLFGSINVMQIAEAITAAGAKVEKREVNLPEGPIRSIGEHSIYVNLHPEVGINVIVNIAPE